MIEQPIIALDFPNQEKTLQFLAEFPMNSKLFVKIGMELYYSVGPAIVAKIKEKGHHVFLDLKLHDIPNTVYKAAYVLGRLGVDLTTIHTAGGLEMLKAGQLGLTEGAKKEGLPAPRLLAITQLTSTNQVQLNDQQGIPGTIENSVIRYAKLAQIAGLAGVICAAPEVPAIKAAVEHTDFQCVTPGIRPKNSENGDQQRVVTPAKARELGSNGIVVGRPITTAQNPIEAYLQIKTEWGN